MLSYRDSVWEDSISLLPVVAPDRIGAAACITTGDTLEVTKLAKVQCVKSFSSLAVTKVSDLTCLFVQAFLDPNPKHSESPSIMF
jgi:hypothetical protein